jgi:hypothetical protein
LEKTFREHALTAILDDNVSSTQRDTFDNSFAATFNEFHAKYDPEKEKAQNLRPIPHVLFEDALQALSEFKNCVINDELRDELKMYLIMLHNRGLILYFFEIEELKDIIFNEIGEFALVFKQLFVHNHNFGIFAFKSLDKSVKGKSNITKSIHKDFIKKLEREGMMARLLLENICIKLQLSTEAFLAILDHLNMAYPVNYGNEKVAKINQYVFFPWYIFNREPRIDINQSDLTKFQLNVEYTGTFPFAMFYTLLVSLYIRNILVEYQCLD